MHPLQALQNGKFALSEISSETKRNPMQNKKQKKYTHNNTYFTIPLRKQSSKYVRFK